MTKCTALWGTRWCIKCGRYIKRNGQRCLPHSHRVKDLQR